MTGRPSALVIGLSTHGLAIVRALARARIDVHALTDSYESPANRTQFAKIHIVETLSSHKIIDTLQNEVARFSLGRGPIALFPTSDKIVRAICENWDILKDNYRISWEGSVEKVLELQNKEALQEYCRRANIKYPESIVIRAPNEIPASPEGLTFPLCVKPTVPLSSFKAFRIEKLDELHEVCASYSRDFPLLLQPWIEGDEQPFCALFCIDGDPKIAFSGRKLRAHPAETGMGTVMECMPNKEVVDLGVRFAREAGINGSIAIEFKRDRAGCLWLIEPNLGRSEYCVDLLIKSGINLPVIEYERITTGSVMAREVLRERIWFDTERDPLAFVKMCLRGRTIMPHGKRPVFPYLGHGDPGPLIAAYLGAGRRVLRKSIKTLRNFVGVTPPLVLERFESIDGLPVPARHWLVEVGRKNPFLGLDWFAVFESEVARVQGEVEWYYAVELSGKIFAVWPFIRRRGAGTVSYMGGYYTPYAAFPTQRIRDPVSKSWRWGLIRQILRTSSTVSISPVTPEVVEDMGIGWSSLRWGMLSYPQECSANWREPISGLQDYFERRPNRLKNTLRRTRKKTRERFDVRFAIYQEDMDLDIAISDYFKVYERSWKPAEPHPEFIAAFIRQLARKKSLRLGLIYLDDTPVAAQLWLVQGTVAYIYKLAYDEKYKDWSVGTQLTAHMLESVVEQDGVIELDYLTGDDGYKKDWMTERRPLYAVTIIDLMSTRGWLFLGGQIARRVRNSVFGAGCRDAPPQHRQPGVKARTPGHTREMVHDSATKH